VRVATWNVNSVIARTERLLRWLERYQPDVLCLQELKAVDDKFPEVEVRALGYEIAVFGQAAYNGVAILSKRPVSDVRRGLDPAIEGEDARLISADVGGTRVIGAYVPNGGEVGSDKFEYKMAWLRRLRVYLGEHHRADEPLILCGDFNCALDDRDVAKKDLHDNTVLTHPEIRAAVRDLESWGLVDTFRSQHEEGGAYSWWDYRMLGFPKNNGLRIDLLYATPPLAATLQETFMDRDERKGKKPSDHVPVMATFSDG